MSSSHPGTRRACVPLLGLAPSGRNGARLRHLTATASFAAYDLRALSRDANGPKGEFFYGITADGKRQIFRPTSLRDAVSDEYLRIAELISCRHGEFELLG